MKMLIKVTDNIIRFGTWLTDIQRRKKTKNLFGRFEIEWVSELELV